ncbi:hypothetical protein AUH73_05915 [archaeon 13_1_40CM_4_53_4]|nr:MAG: hypothetical protein AUI07_04630 [archaeon 13_2_20CM_2_53_6]OLC61935.1 MAG: hypothetical protein AUH73_05915 [archaeon 13_1_40CM_4_53_4]OLE58537.1 MAG: hypothetical protein AUG17_06955 [Crenarchaeota archaeon 13_1_20CM_2_53_14]TMI27650.1 MAG: hypothetical protein E6H24_00725 [Candidatus Bathyarchaeota archaeon]
MAKFIMSIGDEAFKLLSFEATNRDVTVQQLLRAVIVPEWIKHNMDGQTQLAAGAIRPIYGVEPRRSDPIAASPVNRLRT